MINKITLFLSTIVLLTFCISIKGQVNSKKLFKIIPKERREILISRLNLFIAYNKSLKFDELYDLLSNRYKKNHSLDRQLYINHNENLVRAESRELLIEFTPIEVVKFSEKDNGCEEEFEIRGKAKYRIGNKTYKAEKFLFVCSQNNNWYFTDFLEADH